jgi:hypothetical protein
MTSAPQRTTKTSSLTKQQSYLNKLLGPYPLIMNEDPKNYKELLLKFSEAVKPSDFLEEIWVRDIVDLEWEILRLRRLKASLMCASAHKGLENFLLPFFDYSSGAHSLAKKWAKRDPDAISEVCKWLITSGLTMDTVMAQTLSVIINDIERIDTMTMRTEMRRNAAVREIERHRFSLAERLRLESHNKVKQVEDAEFEVVKPARITARNVA